MEGEDLLELRIQGPRDALVLRRELRAVGLHLGADVMRLHRLCAAVTHLVRRLAGAGGGRVVVRTHERQLEVHVIGLPLELARREGSSLPDVVHTAGDVIVLRVPLPASLPTATAPPPRGADRAALDRARGELQRVASALGHDLKAPIHTIQVYATLLTRQVQPEGADHVHQIIASCERLLGMLDGLLDEVWASHDPEPCEPADPGPALLEAIQNLDPELRSTGAVLELSRLPALPVPHVHLVQIFQNLLSNSLKYRRDRPPEIRVEGATDTAIARIRFSDNGRGIPAEERARVFDRFARLARDRDQQGNGLGLALVAQLVARYGGRIRVEPKQSHGTTFIMDFPTEGRSPPGR